MGKVIMSGIVPSLATPIRVFDNFEDNSWEAIIAACRYGRVPDTWAVGDQKAMSISGADYLVDIIGKEHDVYADGSGIAPLTLQLHGLYATSYAMNTTNTNVGGWSLCEMRNNYLPEVAARMPATVYASIRKVAKLTSYGGSVKTVVQTKDSLFLLSEVEVFGATQFSVAGEGSQYAYYAAGNSTIKVNPNPNFSNIQWLRSAYSNSSAYFCRVLADGGWGYGDAYSKVFVAPAFCF